MIRRSASALATFAATVALAGCASMGGKADEYAPTWPELPAEAAAPANGSIYQTGTDVRLFENAVARRVGDVLIVKLQESTAASKSSSTDTKKATKIALPGPTIAGRPVTAGGTPILENSIDNSSTFAGSGNSSQSNTLSGNLAVTVAKVLPNGSLVVRGEKWLTLNQGREFVRLQGIVRSVDIEPDNTIASYKVANASIAYGGKGALASANSPGLLARFFNSKWSPF